MTEAPLTDIALTTLDGRPTTLAELADCAALLVNVASKCGLTPQYSALEQLAKDYGGRGLTVIGDPQGAGDCRRAGPSRFRRCVRCQAGQAV